MSLLDKESLTNYLISFLFDFELFYETIFRLQEILDFPANKKLRRCLKFFRETIPHDFGVPENLQLMPKKQEIIKVELKSHFEISFDRFIEEKSRLYTQ